MKPAIVLIFSLTGTLPALATCTPVAATPGAEAFWRKLTQEFGEIDLPRALTVCTGKRYFSEVKGGAKLKSALDRRKLRILRRDTTLQPLSHELAHLYIDLRWKVLPYSVSEPFAEALSDGDTCQLRDNTLQAAVDLQRQWRARDTLDRCAMRALFLAIVKTDANTRDSLPLR